LAFPLNDDRVNRDAEMQQDRPEVSSFITAAKGGDIATLQARIGAGADINLQNVDGHTALIAAVTARQGEMVKTLIAIGAKLDVTDNNGLSALLWSAFYGYADIAEILIDAGAKLNESDIEGGTALIWAARGGFTDIVIKLRDAGADLESRDKDGHTALLAATRNGHADSAASIEAGFEKRRLAEAWSASKPARDHETLRNHTARARLKLPGF